MKRRLFPILLTLTIALSLLPTAAFAAEFNDVGGHWAEAAIERWADYNVIGGTGQGRFDPNGGMTRAHAAQVFTNLLGLTDTTGARTFSDVPADAWYADAIARANAAGILTGVSANRVSPNGTVTREQFFVMFARALGLEEQAETSGARADGDAWAAGYINALTDKGYVKGGASGVNALANIDRASVISLLDQTISAYVNTDGATVTGDGGVVLVAARGVTVTGKADTLVVAAGADGAAGLTLSDASIDRVNVTAGVEIAVEGTSRIGTVAIAEQAGGASLSVAKGASVASAATAAAGTAFHGAGALAKVEATGAAADSVEIDTPNTVIVRTSESENADGSKTQTVVEGRTDALGNPSGETKTETVTAKAENADGSTTTTTSVTVTNTDIVGESTTAKTETEVTESTADDGTKTTVTTVQTKDIHGRTTKTRAESVAKETVNADGSVTTVTVTTTTKTDIYGRVSTEKEETTATANTAADGSVSVRTTIKKTDSNGKVTHRTTIAYPDGNGGTITETVDTGLGGYRFGNSGSSSGSSDSGSDSSESSGGSGGE